MEADRNLYIKNMVCDRCIMAVKQALEQLGTAPLSVVLGRAELPETPTETQRGKNKESTRSIGIRTD